MADKKSLQNASGSWVWGKDHYESNRGGGTPTGEENAFGKNVKVNPSGKGRHGWRRVGQPGKREDEQPRDKEGHFTYNSMIGKPLKDISKSHGHSRGTTVPPMFNGGINGPKDSIIHDKSGKAHFNFEDWRGVWFEKGTEVAAFGAGAKGQTVIKIAPDNMLEMAQEWVLDKFNEKVEWKTVEGNHSLTYRVEKDENGKEKVVNKKFERTHHKILVYKGTDTPVNFSKLYEDHGDFGHKEKGKEVVTGDISKWQSKSGRPSQEAKRAMKNTREDGQLSAVRAKGEEEADLAGGKINKKYLEDKAEQDEIEGEEQLPEKGEEKPEEEILPIPEEHKGDKHWGYSRDSVVKLNDIKNQEDLNEVLKNSADSVMLEESIIDTLSTVLQQEPEEIEDNMNSIIESGKLKDPEILSEILKTYDKKRV